MPALNPRDIVDVKDEPIIDPVTKLGTRIDPATQQISEPTRRAVTYRDGSVEYFEWDKRGEQPPGPVPWGRQLPTVGTNQPVQNDWERAQKEPTGRGTEGGAPYIVGGQRFDPITNTMVDIPGYRSQTTHAPVNVGEGGGRIYNPENGQITNIPPTAGYIDQQAAAQAAQQDTAAERWATFFRQQYADSISQAVAQGTLSETQAANVWKRMTDIFVDWPKVVGQEARAAEATRQTGASNAGRYGLDVTQEARAQGENAAKDTQYLAEHAVGGGPGGFLTNMPDLEGARQRAAAGVYNRMPDYNALLAQQPQTPYYGAEELAQTQELAMPYLFGGTNTPPSAPQQPRYRPEDAYAYGR